MAIVDAIDMTTREVMHLSGVAVGDRIGAAYEESLAILVEKVEE